MARARIVSGMSFPGHTQLHTDWEWSENEATMYHSIRNEDFRNAAQQAFENRYFRNRYRLDENTLLLTFDP